MITGVGKSPQPPFQGGVNDPRSVYVCVAHYTAYEQSRFFSPLKRGLGGFSELTSEVDKLFNSQS